MARLKNTVVTFASNAGVISTVQHAAQAVLHNGWSLLLPTAEERARALSSLLPTAGRRETNGVIGKGWFTRFHKFNTNNVGVDTIFKETIQC